MTDHNALPDAQLHEPKGAEGASVGEVYVADGAGSGAFGDVPSTSISGLSNT